MAASLFLCNFLSFFTPTTKPPPKTSSPPHLSLSSQKSKNKKLVSLKAQEGGHSVSSLSTELSSVIYPSLASANTLFFSSAYNVQVVVEENEPEERLVNRFRREVLRAGVIQECKRRRFFENKHEEKKRKAHEAAKRNRRRRSIARNAAQTKPEDFSGKKDEDEDNWELPEGDLPY